MTTNPDITLNDPPKQTPTPPMIMKYPRMCTSKYLIEKNKKTRIAIMGANILAFTFTRENTYPRPTDPKILAIS